MTLKNMMLSVMMAECDMMSAADIRYSVIDSYGCDIKWSTLGGTLWKLWDAGWLDRWENFGAHGVYNKSPGYGYTISEAVKWT